MRGGFVACLGGNAQVLERVVEHMRWHRGKPVRHHCGGVEIAAFVDAIEGPIVETRAGTTTLVHGSSPAPLAELQRNGKRFAALEWDGRILRASRDPLGLAPLFYRVFPAIRMAGDGGGAAGISGDSRSGPGRSSRQGRLRSY